MNKNLFETQLEYDEWNDVCLYWNQFAHFKILHNFAFKLNPSQYKLSFGKGP